VITWYVIHGDGWIPPRSRFVDQLGSTSVALFFMITAFLFLGPRALPWQRHRLARVLGIAHLPALSGLSFDVRDHRRSVIVLTWPRRPESAASQIEPVVQWLLMFRAPDLKRLAQHAPAGGRSALVPSLRVAVLPVLAFPRPCRRSQPPAFTGAALRHGAVLLVYWAALNEPFDKGTLFSFAGGIIAAHWVRRPRLVEIGRSSIVGVTAVAALLVTMVCFPTAFHWEGTILLSVFFVAVASGKACSACFANRPCFCSATSLMASICCTAYRSGRFSSV